MSIILDGADIDLVTEKVTHSVVLVSPDTAKRWLKANAKNRPIDEPTVLMYAQQMVDGLWQFAADPIRFNDRGELSDGQHRLTAITVADITLPFLVIRGLQPETQRVMDQGRKRTPGNQLYLSGIKHANNVAAAARQLILIDNGMMFRDSKQQRRYTSAAHIEQYIADHPEVSEITNEVIKYATRIDSRPSIVLTFAVLACRKYNVETVAGFLRDVATLASLPAGHPAHTLDRRLRSIRKNREQLTARELLALFIQAFNAYTGARRITQFLRPSGGWNVHNFPVIAS